MSKKMNDNYVKTPAMVLQELSIKMKYSQPEYILENYRMNTHINEFHYRVEVGNIIGKGIGTSKQFARHDAAKNALFLLKIEGIYDPDVLPVSNFRMNDDSTDNSNNKIINAIGLLKDKCSENKLPQPIFIEISDVGPPHCRLFTYECKINSVATQGIAYTKKQAKQLAAKSMLEKLKDIMPDIVDVPPNAITQDDVINKFIEVTGYEDTLPNKVSRNPLIIELSIGLDTPFSVMAIGNDEDNAIKKLMAQVFDILYILMNANVDE